MASTSKDHVQASTSAQNNHDDLEPGACPESILNPTDSFDEFASEMSCSLQELNKSLAIKSSTISEIQSEIGENEKDGSEMKSTKSSDDLQSKNVSFFLF